MRPCGVLLRLFFIVLAIVLAVSRASWSQQPATMTDSFSTQERLRRSSWWPTKGAASRQSYTGPSGCAQCHGSIAATQQEHSMARALAPAQDSMILRSHASENFRLGSFAYSITHEGRGGFSYSVSDGTRSVSSPITWAFGIGKVGQSYISQEGGTFRELRFSYFHNLEAFDVTPNQSIKVATSLDKARGRVVSHDEIQKCFACHSTASTASDRFDPAQLIPGVTCEACHGPGADHAAAMKSKLDVGTELIFNPGHLKPVDLVDFCGACHTSWWDVTLHESIDVPSVRFQPYRLERSRCWGKGDPRITCVGCHDPHKPLVRDTSAYDAQCLGCHVSGPAAKTTSDHPGAACPQAKANCVSCHMPKYPAADMHFEYTDHQIRVARPGEPFRD
jgi:Cytochrome c554 and c-prime